MSNERGFQTQRIPGSEGGENAKISNIKSAFVDLPFKRTSYGNYLELTQSLLRQGLLSLYKGNGVRCMHLILFQYLKTDLGLRIEKPTGGNFGRNLPYAKEFLIATMVDFLLHPLHVAEARFIMQNRHTNFSAYPSLSSFFKETPRREMYRGMLLHIPRNLLICMSGDSKNIPMQAL